MIAVEDPTFDALWQQVVDDWDDDARHGKFLAYAQASGALGRAASRYKSVTTTDSPYRISDKHLEDARKRLAGVAMLAVMNLDAGRSEPVNPKHQWGVRIFAIVVVLALFGALAYLYLQR